MTKTDRKDLPKLNAAERPAVDPPTTMTSKRCLLFPCVDVKEGEEISDTTPDILIRNDRTSSCCKLCFRNFIMFAQQQEALVLNEGAKEKPSQRLLHKKNTSIIIGSFWNHSFHEGSLLSFQDCCGTWYTYNTLSLFGSLYR